MVTICQKHHKKGEQHPIACLSSQEYQGNQEQDIGPTTIGVAPASWDASIKAKISGVESVRRKTARYTTDGRAASPATT